MSSNKLAGIKQVDLRKAWAHEASDFTNWLAEEENLRLLADELDIEMNLVQTEAVIGRFNADILAEEIGTGNKIVIENQLEATNHDHLGKIITYASGFDATMVIWIVKEAREEHRKAIDWLNEHTDEELAFFLVRIELWQIDNSPLAPKFEIISKPNDWAKSTKQSASGSVVTETKSLQLAFWEQLKAYAQKQGSKLRLHKAKPQHWLNIAIGTGIAHISLTFNSFDGAVRVELYIPDNKKAYQYLADRRVEIEKELGMNLVWMELQDRKASRIKTEISGQVENESEWEDYNKWMLETAEKFEKVFQKYLKRIK